MFGTIRLLPWQVQLATAALVLAMGFGAIAMFPSSPGALLMLVVSLVTGVPLWFSGFGVRSARLLEAFERARAEGEMAALQQAVDEAQARGSGVDRMLLKRGYSSEKIRRWIALECDVVLPRQRT
jgi:hypothetical protein